VILIELEPLLKQLPTIFEYFVPGYFFIIMFQYFTSRKFGSYVMVGSIAISYILKASCSWLHTFIFAKIEFGWSKRAIVLCVVSCVLSIIFIKISECRLIKKVFLKVNNKSIHNDIWSDIIEYKDGTTLRIVCDDYTYTGKLFMYEEKGEDSWFSLEDYVIEENNTNVDYNSQKMGIPCRIAIRLADANRIELYYGEHQKSKFVLRIEKNGLFRKLFKLNKNI